MQSYIIIVPAYNVEKWIGKCLQSIESQERKKYQNIKVLVIDDCSTDGTWDIIQEYPFKSVRNEIHNGSVLENMVKAIGIAKPEMEDVIMVLDGDDCFADSIVLSYLDEVYKKYVWFTYGQFEPLSKSYQNFCKPILNTKTYRKNEEWTIGQLRTFKSWLWDHVYKEDLRDADGKYFTVAGDRAFTYPMIEMAGKHLRFIEKVLYIYNDLNPLNEFKIKPLEIIETSKYIQNKPCYKEL